MTQPMYYLSNTEPVNPVYLIPSTGLCTCGGIISTTYHNSEPIGMCDSCGILYSEDDDDSEQI
jgi:hypothetical protein